MAPSPENDNTPKAPDKNDKGTENKNRQSGNGHTETDTRVCNIYKTRNYTTFSNSVFTIIVIFFFCVLLLLIRFINTPQVAIYFFFIFAQTFLKFFAMFSCWEKKSIFNILSILRLL